MPVLMHCQCIFLLGLGTEVPSLKFFSFVTAADKNWRITGSAIALHHLNILPVIVLAVSITCLTEKPLPFPKLKSLRRHPATDISDRYMSICQVCDVNIIPNTSSVWRQSVPKIETYSRLPKAVISTSGIRCVSGL